MQNKQTLSKPLVVMLLAAFILLRVLVFRKKRRYHSGVGSGRSRGNYRGSRR